MKVTSKLLPTQSHSPAAPPKEAQKLDQKARTPKSPKLIFSTCEEISAYREQHRLTQVEFWSRIGVSQSCGSRYENGRKIPKPIRQLLHIAYATPKQSNALTEWLRNTRV